MKEDSYYENLDKRSKEYKDWKKSKGLGDSIEKVTKATGIKKAVEWFSEKTGIDCGCDERKEKLNKLFSYGKNPNCMTEEQFKQWKAYKETKSKVLKPAQRKMIAEVHASLFSHRFIEPCTCNPKAWLTMIKEIDKVYLTYIE